MTMGWLFLVAPLTTGTVAVVLGMRWALSSTKKERAPWLALLERTADDVAPSGFGVVEGVVNEQDPIEAPFSGRPCVGYHARLIGRTHHMNEYRYQVLAEVSHGQFTLTTPRGAEIAVDLEGADVILPPELIDSQNLPPKVRAYSGGGDRAPERIQAFASELGDAALWAEYFNPNRDKIFTAAQVICLEHRVEAGAPLVVAGDLSSDDAGVQLARGAEGLFFGLGSLADERKRVRSLPVASELFGAVLLGAIIAGVTGLVLSLALRQ